MSPTEPDRITVYADYVCPFCYLGRESLSQYRDDSEEPPGIDWHPFDLRSRQRGPDGEIDESLDSGKDEEYYEEARQNVRRLAEEYGVDMTLDLAREVDSRNAQLASVHVQMEHPDDWLDFDRALYDALWQDGRDIGAPDVLAELGSDAGLDPDEIRAALDDPMVERRLEDQFETARIRGVTGVPTFVYGEHTVRGAVPPAQLRRLVEGV